MKEEITNRLVSIFNEVGIYVTEADYDEILDIDSLQFVTIIIRLEEEFMIRISSDLEDFSDLKSFNDILNLVNKYYVDLSV